jgi:hypothetical protein
LVRATTVRISSLWSRTSEVLLVDFDGDGAAGVAHADADALADDLDAAPARHPSLDPHWTPPGGWRWAGLAGA